MGQPRDKGGHKRSQPDRQRISYPLDFAGIVPDMQPGDASRRTIVALGLGQGAISLLLFAISTMIVRSYDLGRARHEGVLRRLAERRARVS